MMMKILLLSACFALMLPSSRGDDSATTLRRRRVNEKCWSDFVCPTPHATPAVACPWSIWDCDCTDGFQQDGDTDTCIPVAEQICWSTFTCPDYATPLKDCPWSIWDCACEEGFVRDGDTNACLAASAQTCWSSFVCPSRSTPNAQSGGCPWSIWDCDCEEGYVQDEATNTCIDKAKCWSSFTCPSTSSPTKSCPWSIWDCVCNEGLVAHGDTNTCVHPLCEGFSCPMNTVPSRGICSRSIYDCKCDDSSQLFDRDTGKCYDPEHCPLKCPPNAADRWKSSYHCTKYMGYCRCDKQHEGWILDFDAHACVREVDCSGSFSCPENSSALSYECPKTFHRCKCDAGFEKSTTSETCVPKT